MVFSSLTFIIFFMPSLLAVYFLIPSRFRRIRNLVLLVFSLAFYAFGGLRFLSLLIASIIINYISGLLAANNHRRGVRILGVILAAVLGLGLLGWFKYAGFFAEIINSMGGLVPVPEIVLPVGISFFTFQGLSYVIDVYRGDAECQRNPLNVALYIAFFPQLVAGPIVRYTAVCDDIEHRKETVPAFSAGAVRFMCGLAKKMLLANTMGEITDAIYAQSGSSFSAGAAWIAAAAYTFQIYFDFSAYSDMAIGLGRMFGFRFPENFRYPYISESITEFWRRWHISLSTWFRDYVYIPLGGSYCGKIRNIFNLTLVWLLTGLWHGAAWNFVIWGAWYLVFLVGEKFIWRGALERMPKAAKHVYTMLIVVIGWVFFRAPDMASAGEMLKSMAFMNGAGGMKDVMYYLTEYWPEWMMCIAAALPVKILLEKRIRKSAEGGSRGAYLTGIWGPKIFALLMLVLSYMKLVSGSFNPFIYFQF